MYSASPRCFHVCLGDRIQELSLLIVLLPGPRIHIQPYPTQPWICFPESIFTLHSFSFHTVLYVRLVICLSKMRLLSAIWAALPLRGTGARAADVARPVDDARQVAIVGQSYRPSQYTTLPAGLALEPSCKPSGCRDKPAVSRDFGCGEPPSLCSSAYPASAVPWSWMTKWLGSFH